MKTKFFLLTLLLTTPLFCDEEPPKGEGMETAERIYERGCEGVKAIREKIGNLKAEISGIEQDSKELLKDRRAYLEDERELKKLFEDENCNAWEEASIKLIQTQKAEDRRTRRELMKGSGGISMTTIAAGGGCLVALTILGWWITKLQTERDTYASLAND